MTYTQFTLFSTFFGELVDDALGSIVYGFETISSRNAIRANSAIQIPERGGVFIVVQRGVITTKFLNHDLFLSENAWCATDNGANFTILTDSVVAVFQTLNYHGTISFGIIEPEGRLKYIDGCKDSILFQPIKHGLPCLNALYMPNGIHQTAHTHPSARAGIILSGFGRCVAEDRQCGLHPGAVFYLPANKTHKFRTDYSGAAVKLAVYHPDSVTGHQET